MDRFRTKQPAEAYFIEFDFKNKIGTAVTVSSAVVSAKIVSTGVDVTDTITTVGSQTVSGQSAYVWVKAGSTGVDYQITCVATCSDSSVHELEGLMLVSDIPLATPTAGTGPGRVIPPIIEPVSLAELKLHLRLDDDDSTEDALLNSILVAVREHVEGITRRALLTQTWDFCLDEFPRSDFIKLPFGNLQSVTSVKWKDTDGTETTLTVTTDYLVETNGDQHGRLVLPYGETWPSDSLYPSNPITIRFVAGWTTAELVPYGIKAAILMLCYDLYNNRGKKVLSQCSFQQNDTVDALLHNHILWGEF